MIAITKYDFQPLLTSGMHSVDTLTPMSISVVMMLMPHTILLRRNVAMW